MILHNDLHREAVLRSPCTVVQVLLAFTAGRGGGTQAPGAGGAQRSLADIIMDKIRDQQAAAGNDAPSECAACSSPHDSLCMLISAPDMDFDSLLQTTTRQRPEILSLVHAHTHTEATRKSSTGSRSNQMQASHRFLCTAVLVYGTAGASPPGGIALLDAEWRTATATGRGGGACDAQCRVMRPCGGRHAPPGPTNHQHMSLHASAPSTSPGSFKSSKCG